MPQMGFFTPRLNWREVRRLFLKAAFCSGMSSLAVNGLSQAFPSMDALDKMGAWGLLSFVMWWVFGTLSKRLEKLSDSNEKLTTAVDKLAERVHDNSRSQDQLGKR